MDCNAYNLLQSVVPLRSHIALKGDSFHEYLSSLSQISRFGTTQLSESIDRRRRRRYVSYPSKIQFVHFSKELLKRSAEVELICLSSIQIKNCRAPAAQHYLSSGRLGLSQDDISLLGQYNCYQKVSPGSEA